MKASSARLKAYAALVSVAAIWGIAGPVIKGTLEHIPPFTFLFYRFLVVCIVTIPWYIYYLRKHPVPKKDWFALTVLSYFATTVYLALIFLGFEKTTSLDGTLLGILSPIFIVLLGVIFLKEKVILREKIGLAIVMAGTLVTIVQPLFDGHAFPLQNLFGNIIIVSAGIMWAIFTLISKKTASRFPAILVTLHGSVVALVTYAPLAFHEYNYSFYPIKEILASPTALFGIVYMSIISYIVAFYLYQYGMSKIEISEGSMFTYLHPLFALPLAYFWLGETISLPFIVGAFLIAVGVVFAERK